MFNHEPEDYKCPLCLLVAGVETEHNKLADIVYQDKQVTAFVAPMWWKNNPGHVLVIPNAHFENIYDLPDGLLGDVYRVVKKMSVAMRHAYGCDGTSTRQHNEPGGDQDVWHLHVHVFPRYKGDLLYQNSDQRAYVDAAQRAPYVAKLRAYLSADD